jgi:hypothetical protein
MKALFALGVIVFVGLGVVLFSGRTHKARPEETTAGTADDVESLRREVSTLRAEVHRLSRANAAYFVIAQGKGQTASDPESAAADKPVPPNPEQQAALFREYFTTLDNRRGWREDSSTMKAFDRALESVKPEYQFLKRAKIDRPICGNDLCRISLAFDESDNRDMIRTELLFQLGPLVSEATVYADPAKPMMTAYVATNGTKLPPFPSASN